jgi:hypothetical protein
MKTFAEPEVPNPTEVTEDGEPTWITPDGWRWTYEPCWEGCEHGMQPYDPEQLTSPDELLTIDPGDCTAFTSYVGIMGAMRRQLCSKHFVEHLRSFESAGTR